MSSTRSTPTPQVVADIMTRDVVTVSEENNLQEVQVDMDVFRKRHLPVVDGKRLVGMLSHRDMLRVDVGSLDRNSITDSINATHKTDTFVAEVMATDLVTTTADTPLAQAARKLAETHYGCLPVVAKDGALVGIVTEHDFVLLVAQLLEGN